MAHDHAVVGGNHHVEFQGLDGRVVERAQESRDGVLGQQTAAAAVALVVHFFGHGGWGDCELRCFFGGAAAGAEEAKEEQGWEEGADDLDGGRYFGVWVC